MDVVAGLRAVIQDLLVPELKAIQTGLKHHNQRVDSLNQRLDSFSQEMKELRQEMQEGFRRSDERWEVLAKGLAAMEGKLDVLKLEVARLTVRVDQKELAGQTAGG